MFCKVKIVLHNFLLQTRINVDMTLVPGQRVEVGGERATVRWEGEVGNTGQVWLGVEWDKTGRGKHDGNHNGVNYFSPVRPGNNSSFIKRSKVTEWGKGLLAAVSSKYGIVDGVTAGVDQKHIDELQAEIGARFVEVVGFDKVNKQQSQMKKLRTVSVRNMGVCGGGDGDLSCELPSLRDLDLSESLISSWSEVAKIVNDLKLSTLDLSDNLIDVATLSPETREMPTVKHLVLGNMLYSGYTWDQVLQVTSRLESLSILQVHNNSISRLSSFDKNTLSNLTELDLDGNNISDWTEVNKVSGLPALQHLRLNGNKLTNVVILPGTFAKLESLHLTDNCIADWPHIGSLNLLGLSHLRLRNNPVISSCKDDEVARQLIIARISSIKTLNATAITSSERKWAEIDYLKKYGQGWLQISKLDNGPEKSDSLKTFLDGHNRYDEIVKTYGEPDPSDGVKVDTTLKASLLRLKIRSPDVIGSAETVKKIPSSMNVRALRALLQRLYKRQAGNTKLRISLLSDTEDEVEIDNDMRDISFYSVKDGDTLLVRWSEPGKMPIVTDL